MCFWEGIAFGRLVEGPQALASAHRGSVGSRSPGCSGGSAQVAFPRKRLVAPSEQLSSPGLLAAESS